MSMQLRTDARFIHQIIVKDGRSKRVYTKGELMELKNSSGEIIQSYLIANISEMTEQYETQKAHLVYIVSDEYGNTLVKIHAGNDSLEIICNPK